MRRTALAAFALTAAACSNAPAQPVPDNPEEAASVVTAARSCDLTQFEDSYTGAPEAEFEGNPSPADRNQLNSGLWLEAIDERPCVYALPSGLRLRVLRAAGEDAASPEPGEMVRVHYEGLFPNGGGFDSSYDRGTPADFPSDRLIAGWVEALGHMRSGEEWELFIPSGLAYGERGTPGGPIGPNQALYFRMELLCLPSREDANCPEG
ncbi:FKBP-type peptidyl-prolyl cis-trans isomerase [Hyphobacterium sp. SN044]|uniref:FKBP-type peptidyl-prolyl cis-trans isomerase n=1 Tax=Hyphobacterium sp. SN044 TaxID=2912575 RepID=UPI001F02B5CA|nr:FKBP-type peptidyl-prolyl cis-trans isomerase [Hyphobacterium sp. SN044]MCF8880623.1 FKBP-type peptidyl-prolyl cis-trans isomerase [Hyphobacterium sp. SN044]